MVRMVLFIVACIPLFGGSTATETIQVNVHPICMIEVFPETVSMTIDESVNGELFSISEGSWEFVNNFSSNVKVTGELDLAMPGSTSLSVFMDGPGDSLGEVALSVDPQNLIETLTRNAISELDLSFTFAAEVTDAPKTFTRIVTYTLGES